MKLSELSPAEGSVRVPYRKGRGAGSGNGKTGGRGHKGQKARSGGKIRVGFGPWRSSISAPWTGSRTVTPSRSTPCWRRASSPSAAMATRFLAAAS